MARIKIQLPEIFTFSTEISIRITDLNYGGHVGNDTILSLLHEARVQFLEHFGYKELDLEGLGLIMGDVMIEFRKELFYGDKITIHIAAGEFTRVGFDIFYRIELTTSGARTIIAVSKTGMVCFDYQNKKLATLPELVKARLSGQT